ncbi:hypothetical protein S864_000807 [Salmonella enterica subsp. enterica]|nr:hypothetical protein [Salmonella enterica subsp. enterica serovar Abaetetuba]EDY8114330.1 hypothetical protein [Salmonella enterica]EEI9215129.1 hypothetical protein [Salmonella enterica subsp. enterica serovar Carrau]HAE6910949.1 hypothetical protein [Salmonella enterica subsp. enterica serovar Madelia]EDT7013241.1 hypothetical protein [Salmonella enterica subsp. enterica serovar Abaetetuba]
MGAQKGAYEHVFLCIFFVFNLLHCVLSPAFAPSDAIISCLRVAFLCPFLSRFVYICL